MIKLNPIRIFIQNVWEHPVTVWSTIGLGVLLFLLELYYLFR